MASLVKETPSKGALFSLTAGIIIFLSLTGLFSYLIYNHQPTKEFPYSSVLLMTFFLFGLLFMTFVYVPYKEMKQNPVYRVKGSSRSWSKKKVEQMIESLTFEDGPFIYDVRIKEWNDTQFSLFLCMEIDSSDVIEESKEVVFRYIQELIQSKMDCTVTAILFEVICFDHVKKGQ